MTSTTLQVEPIDLAAYQGREQAYIKHKLLKGYLQDWAYKIGRGWSTLVYVDAFAGPWGTQTPNHEDSSFGAAVTVLKRARRGLRDRWKRDVPVRALLIEKNPRAFSSLQEFARRNSDADVEVVAEQGQFEDKISTIQTFVRLSGPRPFLFLLLDPKGWKGLSMDRLQPILENRSCEVVANVMTRHLKRFLEEPDRVKSYSDFFGRPDARDAILAEPPEQRADAMVREYCRSLKRLCGFDYVSSCVVLRAGLAEVHYYLVFATHHHRGIEVFKRAELEAARMQESVHQSVKRRKREIRTKQAELLLTEHVDIADRLRGQYRTQALEKAFALLHQQRRVLYKDLYCEAMAFPLVTEDDLMAALSDDPNIGFELDERAQESKRREPSVENRDWVILRPLRSASVA